MLTSLHASTSGHATMSEIESFLRVKEDKRRELLKSWGLSARQTVAWSEVWSAIGLDPHQEECLWEALKAPLLLPLDVAPMVGISVETLNGWFRTNTLPVGFPPPICVGPRKKLWVNLDILARRQPEIYADAAGKIRRSRPTWKLPERPSITLDPDLSITTLQKNSSDQVGMANVQSIDPGTDGFMLAEIDELIADINVADENSSVPATPMMDSVLSMLDQEIEAGAASSSRILAKTALRSLLRTRGKRPENTELSLDIYDAWFPLNGWNRVTMPKISRKVYLSYRKRARAAIARTLGVTDEKEKLRRQKDRWSALADWLSGLPQFQDTPASLIAISSTLTMLCREARLSTEDMSQAVMFRLYQTATTNQKRALRNAARIIYDLQSNPKYSLRINKFFPNKVKPIRTGQRTKYQLSEHLQGEIDEFTRVSYRRKYIEITQSHDELADTTREQHKYALRTIIDALISTGHLSHDAETARFALSDRAAMIAACNHVYTRTTRGELAESTAATKMNYLPAILERNGIETPGLRAAIREVSAFRLKISANEMPEETQMLCRHLIDDLGFRVDFLLSHAAPRAAAENIVRAARRAKRDLTQKERTRVRQLGTVALFCALECGCAPIRVENFLEIPVEGSAPWLKKTKEKEYDLHVPATHTKNKKPIKVTLCASDERYLETVEWFLSEIRWLFFWDQAANAAIGSEHVVRLAKQLSSKSDWLVPGVRNPNLSLVDTTFRDWFKKITIEFVGVTMEPHNFRHGQASLLYYLFPDQIETIAARLGDTVETVLRYYAWIHSEKLMRQGQSMLVSTIRPDMQRTQFNEMAGRGGRRSW